MNKVALAGVISSNSTLVQGSAERVLDTLFETIIATVAKGEEVSIVGFGIFSARDRAACLVRNPKTGEKIQVQATRTPKFRAGKHFKDAVKAERLQIKK